MGLYLPNDGIFAELRYRGKVSAGADVRRRGHAAGRVTAARPGPGKAKQGEKRDRLQHLDSLQSQNGYSWLTGESSDSLDFLLFRGCAGAPGQLKGQKRFAAGVGSRDGGRCDHCCHGGNVHRGGAGRARSSKDLAARVNSNPSSTLTLALTLRSTNGPSCRADIRTRRFTLHA